MRMNVHISVPCTECCASFSQVSPWNSWPISLFMASVHPGPAEECTSSLYSAGCPVSGFTVVYPTPGCKRELCLGPSVGTPSDGAGSLVRSLLVLLAGKSLPVLCVVLSSGFWFNVSKEVMSCPHCVVSRVLAKVSVGGFCRITMASSTVAQRRLALMRIRNRRGGSHTTWLTTRTCLVLVAHTVKHL